MHRRHCTLNLHEKNASSNPNRCQTNACATATRDSTSPLRQHHRGRSRYRSSSLSVPRIIIVPESITFSYVSSDRVKA